MLDRALQRPERRSAGAALLASVFAHLGLLLLVLWPAFGRQQEENADQKVTPLELVMLVEDAGPGSKKAGGVQDVTLSAVAPPQPVEHIPAVRAPKQVRIVDDPTGQPAAVPEIVPPTAGTRGSTTADGGATGAGDGNGTSFFHAAATGRTIVFVLDRSMSMGLHDGLRQARTELIATLGRLPPTAQFQVIAYNQIAEPLSVHNNGGLLAVDADTLAEVARSLAEMRPTGLTDHVQALCRGLSFRPEVIYFATDADELTGRQVEAVTRFNGGRCSIHVIEFSNRPEDLRGPLRQLAALNRGTYQRVGVKEW